MSDVWKPDFEKPFREAVGLDGGYAPNSEAPDLDMDLLRGYVNRTIDDEVKLRQIERLIARFKSWHEGHLAAIRERTAAKYKD